jgi:hypothetical protein
MNELVAPALVWAGFFLAGVFLYGATQEFKAKIRAMHACWLPQARSAWQAPVSPSIFNTLLARQAKCINKEPL